MVLRHQVHVLQRQRHARVWYRPSDRAILAAFSRLLPRNRWRSFRVTPRRCCDGIAKRPNTNGDDEENNDDPTGGPGAVRGFVHRAPATSGMVRADADLVSIRRAPRIAFSDR